MMDSNRETGAMNVAQVTIRRQGDSVGVDLPHDVRTRMGLKIGQQMILIELHDGIKLVKHSASLERQFDIARKVLPEQADVLRGLAEYDRD